MEGACVCECHSISIVNFTERVDKRKHIFQGN